MAKSRKKAPIKNLSAAEPERGRQLAEGVWRALRSIILGVCACMILLAGVLYVWQYVNDNYLLPADPDDHEAIYVVITRGTSISGIANQLEEAGIIRSSTAFKLYLDLGGHASKMKAGKYYLNKTMTLQEITEKLVRGDGGTQVTTFLIPEGATVEGMAAILVEQGILENGERFLELCRSAEEFKADYPFISDVLENPGEGRKYMLEGYLFPAKYEIYVGSTEESIIRRMLTKFGHVMNADFMERAAELNLTVDQVVTLASLIEKEGKVSDFPKIGSVFHLRLEKNMLLQTDPTILYFTGKKSGTQITQDDLNADSPYNTYKNKGLPVSAISNPGLDALKAALYPNEQAMRDGYLYFVLKDPETGELEFNKTLAQHNAAVEKYRPLWEEYERKLNQGQGE